MTTIDSDSIIFKMILEYLKTEAEFRRQQECADGLHCSKKRKITDFMLSEEEKEQEEKEAEQKQKQFKPSRYGKIIIDTPTKKNILVDNMEIYLNAQGYGDNDYEGLSITPRYDSEKQQTYISIFNNASSQEDELNIQADIENFHETQYSSMRWSLNNNYHGDKDPYDEEEIHVEFTEQFVNILWIFYNFRTGTIAEVSRYSINLKNVEYYQTNSW